MSAITELADRLGKVIADSPQSQDLRAAKEEMSKDAALGELLKEFQAQSDKIAKLEQENKPVEVDDKHKFDELRQKLIGDERFKKLTAAQVEYVDLMRQVNDAIRKHLTETEGAG